MNNKKLVKDTFWIYIGSIIAGIFGYLLRILYARSLSVKDYGTFYAIYAFLSIIGLIRDFGLTEATIFYGIRAYIKKRYRELRTILFYNQAIQTFNAIILASIMFLLRDLIVSTFFKGNPNAYTMFSFLLVLFIVLTVLGSYANFHRIFQDYLLPGISPSLVMFTIFLSSLLLFKIYPSNPFVPAISYIVGYSLITLIYAIVIGYKHKVVKGSIKPNKKLLRKMYSYALPVMTTSIGVILFYNTDTVLISLLLKNPIEVAKYQVAKPMLNIVMSFVNPLSTILFPLVASLWHKKERTLAGKYLDLSYLFVLVLIIPMSLLLSYFASPLITLMFGSRYADSAPILNVLALSGIFMGLFSISMQALVGFGMVKERARIFYIGAFTNIVLDLLLIPFLSGVGAAIATLFSLMLIDVLALMSIKKKVNISLSFIRNAFFVLIFSLISLIIILPFRVLISNLYLKMAISLIVFGVVYVGLLFLFRIVRVEHLKLVVSYIIGKNKLNN